MYLEAAHALFKTQLNRQPQTRRTTRTNEAIEKVRRKRNVRWIELLQRRRRRQQQSGFLKARQSKRPTDNALIPRRPDCLLSGFKYAWLSQWLVFSNNVYNVFVWKLKFEVEILALLNSWLNFGFQTHNRSIPEERKFPHFPQPRWLFSCIKQTHRTTFCSPLTHCETDWLTERASEWVTEGGKIPSSFPKIEKVDLRRRRKNPAVKSLFRNLTF